MKSGEEKKRRNKSGRINELFGRDIKMIKCRGRAGRKKNAGGVHRNTNIGEELAVRACQRKLM